MILKQKIKDIFLAQAIADAAGVPYEFKSRTDLKKNPATAMIGFGSHMVEAGTWSDDTSMTLATMDAYVAQKGIIDLKYYETIMDNFLCWHSKAIYGKCFDIGNTCLAALTNYTKNKDPLKCGEISEDSCGNGSLMRIMPVAIYMYQSDYIWKQDEIIKEVNNISGLTHNHEVCKIGCVLYVFIVMGLLEGKSLKDALSQLSLLKLDKYFSKKNIKKYKRILSLKILKTKEKDISSNGYIISSLEASIWVVHQSTDLKDTILNAINLGNDTDTIASLSAGLGAIIHSISSIPINWISLIKNREILDAVSDDFAEFIIKSYH